jgi:hypothetical protein
MSGDIDLSVCCTRSCLFFNILTLMCRGLQLNSYVVKSRLRILYKYTGRFLWLTEEALVCATLH